MVSEVFGVSGRAMMKALIENTATPREMADLAKRKLRRKLEPLALDSRLSEHHRYLLAFHLRRVEALEADLRTLDERLEQKAQPYAAQRHLRVSTLLGLQYTVEPYLRWEYAFSGMP